MGPTKRVRLAGEFGIKYEGRPRMPGEELDLPRGLAETLISGNRAVLVGPAEESQPLTTRSEAEPEKPKPKAKRKR